MNHKYHPLSQIIHWLTAILVVIAFVLGPEDVDELDNPSLDLGLQTHETLGLVVFGLTILPIEFSSTNSFINHVNLYPKGTIYR